MHPGGDLPRLNRANAHFVTPQLAVGGDLDPSLLVALRQLDELVAAGVTHIVDVRIGASDADLVARRWPHVRSSTMASTTSGSASPRSGSRRRPASPSTRSPRAAVRADPRHALGEALP